MRLYQAKASVRIELIVANECSDEISIGGTIKGPTSSRSVWVKIISLDGVTRGEARPSEHGSFLVSGLNKGRYFVIVLDGSTPVHIQTVYALGDRLDLIAAIKTR